ncbi:MAG: DUF523 domain-containing protein [Bdellovibrionales bacterium]
MPLKLALSGCLAGYKCNYAGQSNEVGHLKELLVARRSQLELHHFCPEEATMGTPREPMNIVGGTGADVLDGKARVLTHSGVDVTEKMIKGAEQFLNFCQNNQIQVVLLMEEPGLWHSLDL